MSNQSLPTYPATSVAGSRGVKPRRIGIHGIRGAGKTCYLGCLYGFRTTAEVRTTFTEDGTFNYLRAIWAPLQEQQIPGPTALGSPTELRLAIEEEDLGEAHLELCDYAGALVQPATADSEPSTRERSQRLRDWLRSCPVLLLFLDSAQPDPAQLDALDLLLNEMTGSTSDRVPPLAIVLTKWDRQGPVSADLAQEQSRAREFLDAHPVFQQIFRRLRDLEGGQVPIFPVSAFGNHAQDDRPSAPLEPCHLHAPLLWAAQMANLLLLEEAREEARTQLERHWAPLGFPVVPQPDHLAARRAYERLREDYGITRGPVADEVTRELAAIHDSHWGHRLWIAVPLLAVLLVLGLGLLHLVQAHVERSMTALGEFREANPQWESALERRLREQTFLGAWWTRMAPSARARVHVWYEQDQASALEKEQYDHTLALGKELEEKGQWREVQGLYRTYLDSYSQAPSEVRAHLNSEIKELDEVAEDAADYNAFRELTAGMDLTSLAPAAHKGKAYLDSSRSRKAMREEVRAWLDWFEKLKKGGDYTIVVRSVTIPHDSPLNPKLGLPTIRVHVRLGDKEHTTTKVTGSDLYPFQELGPYPFRYGKPGKLFVQVEAQRVFTSNVSSTAEISDPNFILARANGIINTIAKSGPPVPVVLSCPGAIPPPLPEYQRR